MRAKPPAPQQLRLPIGKGSTRQFRPVDWVQQGAKGYAQAQGLNWKDPGPATTFNPEAGHATYLAYRNELRRGGGEQPGIRESYEALRHHIGRQWEYMTSPTHQGGMGMRFEVPEKEPYASHQEMVADVTRNRRIKVFPSTDTPHEFLSGQDLEKFRAVHDVFGHAAVGRSFSREGEDVAYRSHAQMFPPEAQPALASELRGQNAWLNYGPGGFVAQNLGKLVGLPQWASQGSGAPPRPSTGRIKRRGTRQLSLF